MTAEQTTRGYVTPEAVVLEFETAGVGSRALAKMIDVTVQVVGLGFLLLLVLLATGSNGSQTLALILVLLIVFLDLFGYPVLSEVIWNGKTLGKSIMGLRVVTREGAPIRFRHAAVRGLLGVVEIYVLAFIGILSTAVSRNNQRVGDALAGTIVIRERTASNAAIAVTFPPPPGLEAYARSLDVSALTNDQYQVIRSFLMRVFQFTPEARYALGVRLANPVAVALHHDPPPMVNPEMFLLCVAAAYQLRHGGPAATWASAPSWGPAWGSGGGDVGWSAPAYAGTPGGGATGYGPPPGYGPPTGYGPPSAYGPPTGYGPPSAYGPPTGYGPPSAYGPLTGYGPPPGDGPGAPASGSPSYGSPSYASPASASPASAPAWSPPPTGQPRAPAGDRPAAGHAPAPPPPASPAVGGSPAPAASTSPPAATGSDGHAAPPARARHVFGAPADGADGAGLDDLG